MLISEGTHLVDLIGPVPAIVSILVLLGVTYLLVRPILESKKRK